MAIFRPKTWVDPFGKMSIFRPFELLVFIPQTGVFSFQNIVKDMFVAYISEEKKFLKMAIFGPKPFVNPFGKKLKFFDSLNFLFLQSIKVFFVLEYRKRHFPGLYCLKKKFLKMAIFGPKGWVNSFGKMSVFRPFELLVFIPQKGVFSFQNIVKEIYLAYIAL